MTGTEFDQLFEQDEIDILQFCDLDNPRQPNRETRTIAIELTPRAFDAAVLESDRFGIDPHEILASWVEERATSVAA